MYEPRSNPRKEHRQQESQRVEDSPTLAATFQDLKSLTVTLSYFNPGSFTRNSEIKYTANLGRAKSRLRFDCPNEQCIGGGYDLSAELAKAVAERQTNVFGELVCRGCRSETAIEQSYCNHILRYRLCAEYAPDEPPGGPES